MPRLSCPVAIERILAGSPRSRLIVVSSNETRAQIEAALRAGASGYVTKGASAGELTEAIECVHAGRFYLSPSATGPLVELVAHPACSGGDSKLSRLTGREREVLQLIAEGLSAKEIAVELGVAPKTAESHRAHLMEKLGIHKASALVRFAIREGLVSA